MSPTYLEQLARLADPHRLYRKSLAEQRDFSDAQMHRLHTGLALRRYADDVRELRQLLGTGNSLLITPITVNHRDIRIVPTPRP